VINNHERLSLPEKYNSTIVLDNMVRARNSRGHLAHDWNTALIHGFQSLANPASDIVVLLQGDAIVTPDWASKLWQYHTVQNFSFVQSGTGDEAHSYTAEGVRKIGLWDERFPGIGHQEADYFLRAILWNRESTSLNDHPHHRVHHSLPLFTQSASTGMDRGEYSVRGAFHDVGKELFQSLWPGFRRDELGAECVRLKAVSIAVCVVCILACAQASCSFIIEITSPT
jgi:hypothetical protein